MCRLMSNPSSSLYCLQLAYILFIRPSVSYQDYTLPIPRGDRQDYTLHNAVHSPSWSHTQTNHSHLGTIQSPVGSRNVNIVWVFGLGTTRINLNKCRQDFPFPWNSTKLNLQYDVCTKMMTQDLWLRLFSPAPLCWPAVHVKWLFDTLHMQWDVIRFCKVSSCLQQSYSSRNNKRVFVSAVPWIGRTVSGIVPAGPCRTL